MCHVDAHHHGLTVSDDTQLVFFEVVIAASKLQIEFERDIRHIT